MPDGPAFTDTARSDDYARMRRELDALASENSDYIQQMKEFVADPNHPMTREDAKNQLRRRARNALMRKRRRQEKLTNAPSTTEKVLGPVRDFVIDQSPYGTGREFGEALLADEKGRAGLIAIMSALRGGKAPAKDVTKRAEMPELRVTDPTPYRTDGPAFTASGGVRHGDISDESIRQALDDKSAMSQARGRMLKEQGQELDQTKELLSDTANKLYKAEGGMSTPAEKPTRFKNLDNIDDIMKRFLAGENAKTLTKDVPFNYGTTSRNLNKMRREYINNLVDDTFDPNLTVAQNAKVIRKVAGDQDIKITATMRKRINDRLAQSKKVSDREAKKAARAEKREAKRQGRRKRR